MALNGENDDEVVDLGLGLWGCWIFRQTQMVVHLPDADGIIGFVMF